MHLNQFDHLSKSETSDVFLYISYHVKHELLCLQTQVCVDSDCTVSKLVVEAVKKHSQETQYVTYLLFDFSLISVSHSHEHTPRGAVKTDQSSQQGHLIRYKLVVI